MIEQKYNLNLIPDKVPVMVRASQYDALSRTIIFNVFNGTELYEIPSGATVTVRGTKEDNTGFEYSCLVNGSEVSFEIQAQMTIFYGLVPCEIRITSGTEIIGSCNFQLNIEKTPLDSSTEISETQLPLLEEAVQAAVDAQQSASAAAQSASQAEQVLSTAVKSVNNVLPDSNGNVDVDTMPSGGTTGQALVKKSATDFDTEWKTLMGVPSTYTSGNLASIDSSGQVADSGKALSDLQELLTAGRGIDITNNVITSQFGIVASPNLDNVDYYYAGYVTSATNSPYSGTKSGYLLSIVNKNSTGYREQLFCAYNADGWYLRKMTNSTWSSWEKLSMISTPTITIGDVSNSNIIAKQQGDVVFLDGYVVSNAQTYTANSTVFFTTNVKPSAIRFFAFFNYNSAGPAIYVAKWQPDGKVVLNNTITFNSTTYLFFNASLPL